MINFESGVFIKARLVSNILMLLLLVGNIFFSIQYTSNVKQETVKASEESANGATRIQTARFLKLFIDTVLSTQGTVSFDDRVKLENDIRQLGDVNLTSQWNIFVSSKDSKEAQMNAVKLMSLLTNKMI